MGCPVNPVIVSVFCQPSDIWILLSGDGWPLCLLDLYGKTRGIVIFYHKLVEFNWGKIFLQFILSLNTETPQVSVIHSKWQQQHANFTWTIPWLLMTLWCEINIIWSNWSNFIAVLNYSKAYGLVFFILINDSVIHISARYARSVEIGDAKFTCQWQKLTMFPAIWKCHINCDRLSRNRNTKPQMTE